MSSFTIGELAREFRVTTRAIRFYEDRGLIAPAREGQNRVYGARERTRLRLILRGKRLGFSLAEIGEMIDLYDAPSGEDGQLRLFIRKIGERRQALEAQAEDIRQVLEELDALESRCETLLAETETS